MEGVAEQVQADPTILVRGSRSEIFPEDGMKMPKKIGFTAALKELCIFPNPAQTRRRNLNRRLTAACVAVFAAPRDTSDADIEKLIKTYTDLRDKSLDEMDLEHTVDRCQRSTAIMKPYCVHHARLMWRIKLMPHVAGVESKHRDRRQSGVSAASARQGAGFNPNWLVFKKGDIVAETGRATWIGESWVGSAHGHAVTHNICQARVKAGAEYAAPISPHESIYQRNCRSMKKMFAEKYHVGYSFPVPNVTIVQWKATEDIYEGQELVLNTVHRSWVKRIPARVYVNSAALGPEVENDGHDATIPQVEMRDQPNCPAEVVAVFVTNDGGGGDDNNLDLGSNKRKRRAARPGMVLRSAARTRPVTRSATGRITPKKTLLK